MKKKQLIVFMISFLIGVGATVSLLKGVYAKEDKEKQRSQLRMEIQATTQPTAKPSPLHVDEEEADDEKEDKEWKGSWQKSKETEREFELSGVIGQVNSSSFIVNQQEIYIDPVQVTKYVQKGILKSGERVKVKGVIKDAKKYAADINVIGTGQGRFKLILSSLFGIPKPSASPNPTASPSPSTSPSPIATAIATASPEVSPTPLPASPVPEETVSPSPTASPLAEVEEDMDKTLLDDLGILIKMSGPAEKMQEFMDQIKQFFGNLL